VMIVASTKIRALASLCYRRSRLRALSPGINDPGTAIQIIGRLVRLFVYWVDLVQNAAGQRSIKYDRVRVPCPALLNMFDDAFPANARDGAGIVEVTVRLQDGFLCLAQLGNDDLAAAAQHHSRLALSRAEGALTLLEDLARATKIATAVSNRHSCFRRSTRGFAPTMSLLDRVAERPSSLVRSR
jgi:uncharacterized membrane protein